jgi:ABC-type sugar transport system permease subunit
MAKAEPTRVTGGTAAVAVRTRRGARRTELRRGLLDSIFIWPMLVLIGTFVLVPTGIAIYRSFTNWQPGAESPWVGLANYAELVASDVVHQVAKNEAFYMIGVPLWAGVPLVIALLLYERVPASGLFRLIFFFPAILSPVIIGIVFRALLRPDGIINSILGSIGLESLQHNWIDSASLVKPTLLVVVLWYTMGFGVVLYSAALSAVPPEQFEAAEIDGATWFQRLRFVMLPAILPMFILNFVFSVGTVFLLFGYIYVLTSGGPGYASASIDFEIYQNSIVNGYFGLAAAESVLLLLTMTVVLIGAVTVGSRLWR